LPPASRPQDAPSGAGAGPDAVPTQADPSPTSRSFRDPWPAGACRPGPPRRT
jgi:hypothetical protein